MPGRRCTGKEYLLAVSFYGKIPLPEELAAVEDCLRAGLMASDGPYTARLRALFCEQMGAFSLLPTPSATQALELACRLLSLRPGDEVILPSFNFPSAANAVLLAGGHPVLCDIDPDTQNLSVADAAGRVTSRTRAVIAVHYASVGCDMDALSALAGEAGLSVIEDAAQAVDARWRERFLGTIGRLGAYSFHYTKNFSCGEGGALACGPQDAEQADILREKGTNRMQFMRGECRRYTWVQPGTSALLSELCAAALVPQLEARRQITGRRLAILDAYQEALKPLEAKGVLRRMAIPVHARPNGHIVYVRFATRSLRDQVQAGLRERQIDARTHYVPLHLSPMGRSLGYRPEDLPQSAAAGKTLLRLPIHPLMTPEDAYRAVEAIQEVIR
jgi:dTDP-4-amino-4,6-dideoxygalactose transaminase